ncbi:uncharacterized protein N7482_004995 [Penicillium canariense]|uniref:Uncharacterized protein n=1 Tax=Penicillium canariense TaxID=189055 RepID=A0A9W9I1K5_9EURO|nr:uncharacterized protein N7482_004995 [Penicillium canariense]KAJ5166214.1 hypothetical protein N7482_004995 [Penicillium canariense]
MLRVFNMTASHALRAVGALVILLVIFQACYMSQAPIHQVFGSPRPESHEPAATGPLASTLSQRPKVIAPATGCSILNIPDKVWHTAKHHDITAQQSERIRTWLEINPSCRQELLSDRSSEAFVRAHYGQTRPDIVETYEAISIPILRADLFRYLVILAEGGFWGDLDVSCEKPLAQWIPAEYNNGTVDMIVGLEFDMEWRGPDTEVASQFCNWVFAAQPASRNLQVIVDAVVAKLKKIAKDQGVQIEDITLDLLPEDVVNVTGPKMMTISIMNSLKELLGRTVDDRDFSRIKRPKLVGDVLIMPGVSFAALQNGNPKNQGDPLVSHHYEGSWKKEDAAAKERKKQKDLAQEVNQ